jgi:hypothetical protein
MRRRERIVALIAGLAASAALAACGGENPDDDEQFGSPGPDAAEQVGEPLANITPAQIDERPQGFVSSDVLRPLGNAWRAGSRTSFTEVDAGSVATDRNVGALAIFRHDFLTAGQTSKLIEVKEAEGPLRITDAPEGSNAVEDAQQTGKIAFVGRDGTKGTLDLSDDSVTIADD